MRIGEWRVAASAEHKAKGGVRDNGAAGIGSVTRRMAGEARGACVEGLGVRWRVRGEASGR